MERKHRRKMKRKSEIYGTIFFYMYIVPETIKIFKVQTVGNRLHIKSFQTASSTQEHYESIESNTIIQIRNIFFQNEMKIHLNSGFRVMLLFTSMKVL